MAEYKPGDTVSKGQEELPLVSIILSSTFSYSFGLAKSSCNPFMLLSVIFLLGNVLYLKMQTESGSCREVPGKKGQAVNVNEAGQFELPEWCDSFLNLPHK